MVRQTVFGFKLERIEETLTAHGGLALLAEFNHGLSVCGLVDRLILMLQAGGRSLTMQMQMRRFTRLMNRFSKKIENHAAAVALHYMVYNFVKIHKTIRVTPAMAAGVTDHVWELLEIVELHEVQEAVGQRAN